MVLRVYQYFTRALLPALLIPPRFGSFARRLGRLFFGHLCGAGLAAFQRAASADFYGCRVFLFGHATILAKGSVTTTRRANRSSAFESPSRRRRSPSYPFISGHRDGDHPVAAAGQGYGVATCPRPELDDRVVRLQNVRQHPVHDLHLPCPERAPLRVLLKNHS